MLRSRYVLVVMTLGMATAAGCDKQAEASNGTGQPAATQTANLEAKKSPVARLAFLDKADACECTQKTINKGWDALQAALGPGNPMPVDRIHVDTQAGQAAPLLAQRKIVAVPALYLLDANGFVIDMLQGNLEESDVRKALQ